MWRFQYSKHRITFVTHVDFIVHTITHKLLSEWIHSLAIGRIIQHFKSKIVLLYLNDFKIKISDILSGWTRTTRGCCSRATPLSTFSSASAATSELRRAKISWSSFKATNWKEQTNRFSTKTHLDFRATTASSWPTWRGSTRSLDSFAAARISTTTASWSTRSSLSTL